MPLLYFMNSGCVLECRETPTSHVTILSLYPSLLILQMAVTCIYRCFQFRSLANCLMRGRVGTDIGIKLLPVMWVFLCIPRHIHCSANCYYLYIAYEGEGYFKLHVYYSFSANQELNFPTYGENTICRPMYTVY